MEAPLSRTKLLQEIRKMRFDEAYVGWQEKRLTQEQAAEILGVTDRSFRRYAMRYEAEGLEGLIDRRIEAVSAPRARSWRAQCAQGGHLASMIMEEVLAKLAPIFE